LTYLKALNEICPPHAILAFNTSALPISTMASMSRRLDKVLELQFMNPVPVIQGKRSVIDSHLKKGII
jgi:3-hydroxybutyryl-CoA dehydrogenase